MPEKNQRYKVSQVLSGDTLELSNGERVRLIGVDAWPFDAKTEKLHNFKIDLGVDKAHFSSTSELSRDFVEKRISLSKSREILIDLDELHEAMSYRDEDGNLLGYVGIPTGSRKFFFKGGLEGQSIVFLNPEIVILGYAFVDRRYPFRERGIFAAYEAQAKVNQTGIWRGITLPDLPPEEADLYLAALEGLERQAAGEP